MAKQFTLVELEKLTGAKLVGDPNFLVEGVNELENANEKEVSFFANPRYLDVMKSSSAGVICTAKEAPLHEGRNYLISENPSHTFQIIAELIMKAKTTSAFVGIHPNATVADGVEIGESVTVGPNAVIDQLSSIGSRTTIHPNVTVGPGVSIGEDCVIYPGVVIREGCQIGNRVILQPGAIIGSCGYGYTPNAEGKHQKLEQMGIVIIEDDVEIGANTCIDRARLRATKIARGTKIDNLVQIAHNVEIGEDNLIVSQTGIAGSSKTGRHVVMGGQVGVTGHITIGDGVQIATRSGVSKSLTKAGGYRGSPAQPIEKYNRYKVYVRNIEKHVKRIKALEERSS
ncbi:MAG: UDP-3-O-(3-hydroxymyristoyl)glucosamine N-acyltransferase [Simkaniaceae bacterium]|nr:UDP-3-O-(3-hydroxymyristoyl)glucosamine N-acyltransferase [Simkaniaceae bacterium]